MSTTQPKPSASTMNRNSSPMSTIESTVTRLLVATKQLLESLTQWARGDSTEQDVSDVYVNLGNEFNVACRAFLSAGVEVADLGDVPQALRVILEKALSEDASQENLDRYLPSIREIIVNLLRQLKQKQSLIRSSSRSVSSSSSKTQQQQQQSPTGGPHHHPQQQPPPPPPPPHHQYQQQPRKGSSSISSSQSKQNIRSESVKSASSSNVSRRPSDSSGTATGHYKSNHGSSGSEKSSELTRIPSNEQFHRAPPQRKPSVEQRAEEREHATGSNPLAALQRGEALERRASRRFSAYQFAKLTNGTQGAREAVPDLPPLPGTPPSNRSSFLPTKAPQSSSPADFTSKSNAGSNFQGSSPRENIPGTPSYGQEHEESLGMATDQTGPMNLFLQIGRKVKKAVVERSDITIPALRLLFIDKFAYSPGADTFPDIYIQDPQSGIRYELDEKSLDELHPGSLLSLNIEAMDEVKKHIDDGLAGIVKSINELNSKISQNSLQTSKALETAAATDKSAETAEPTPATAEPNEEKPDRLSKISMKHIDSLRHEMSVVRQIGGVALNDFREQAAAMLKKIQTLQASVNLPSPGGTTRSYMESCHKKLSGDTDNLLTNVDDLQDIIEALRKDVAQRGVRPPTKQLESVGKELEQAKQDLDKMEKYIFSERPGWKKIWERELDTICEEQQFFKLQEELVADLQDDLLKATETFTLVEQCSVEQTKTNRKNQTVVVPTPVDGIVHAKDAVLGEVSALQPNHEQRVEAIERAEKLRKRELEMRGMDEFQEELGEFVEENKLKKSGGIEETERRRKLREQKVLEEQRKNDAEAQAIRQAEREKKREEKEKKKKEKKKDKDGSEKEKKKKKKEKKLAEEEHEEQGQLPAQEAPEAEFKGIDENNSGNNDDSTGADEIQEEEAVTADEGTPPGSDVHLPVQNNEQQTHKESPAVNLEQNTESAGTDSENINVTDEHNNTEEMKNVNVNDENNLL